MYQIPFSNLPIVNITKTIDTDDKKISGKFQIFLKYICQLTLYLLFNLPSSVFITKSCINALFINTTHVGFIHVAPFTNMV